MLVRERKPALCGEIEWHRGIYRLKQNVYLLGAFSFAGLPEFRSTNKNPKTGKAERKDIHMKKMIALVLALVLTLSLTTALAKDLTIGIAQFAEHPSLDNCRIGFIEGLAEAGYVEGDNVTFIVHNAQADMGTTQMIAQQLAQECDLVCAIATPMAQAAVNACMDGNVPVIYTAVSDPVAAALAKPDGTSRLNVTGSCDLLPVEAQLKLIRALMPEAQKIGILYTTSETNSESQLKLYESLAPKYGFEIVSSGISMGADIPLAADSLLPKVDCLTNLTDNTVVSYLAVVIDKANTAGKPVFGSEIEQVKNGCIASEGVEYVALGRETGRMAAQVLQGAFAGDIPFYSSEGGDMAYNPDVAAKLGIVIPEAEIARGIDVTK